MNGEPKTSKTIQPETTPAQQALDNLLKQLVVADEYAAAENPGPLSSVWQIQNAHLRAYALAARRALNA